MRQNCQVGSLNQIFLSSDFLYTISHPAITRKKGLERLFIDVEVAASENILENYLQQKSLVLET